MQMSIAAMDIIDSIDDAEMEVYYDTEFYSRKNASLALQRALRGAGAWMVPTVRDDRKCDHELQPIEMPVSIREKVARLLQDQGGEEKEPAELPDTKASWYQQLERHVAHLMHQLKKSPQLFREMLLLAASKSSSDSAAPPSTSLGDARSAYRRVRRTALTLGEEIFNVVTSFVRRSQAHGVLPEDAQTVRLASLYKLELRRHVTISAVMDCIQRADSGLGGSCKMFAKSKSRDKRNSRRSTFFRRQSRSAGATSGNGNVQGTSISARAASAPTDRGIQGQQTLDFDSNSPSDKVKSVHAFKLQALERILAKTWQGNRSTSINLLQAVPGNPTRLSEDTMALIQERVTAFLYHRNNRDNYPLWSEPLLSKEETAKHLRVLLATLLASPLFRGLSIEQLLEVARFTRWQMLAPGDKLCTCNTEIDTMFIVLQGSLGSSAVEDITSEPESSLCGSTVVVTAPVCLGELGMVRNAECWPQTWTAISPAGAKALLLPKLTFEGLLQRLVSGKLVSSGGGTNIAQPSRPTSSPAVVAKHLTRPFRSSLPGRRPSTATPTAAIETNVARWHEIRDEKLRDFRAGLEAEQRAAALAALQCAMEELSSLRIDEDDDEMFSQNHIAATSNSRSPRSRHHYYPEFTQVPATKSLEETHQPEASQLDSGDVQFVESGLLDHSTKEASATEASTDAAQQLRDYYKNLNSRRSVMHARLASNAPSDQLCSEQSPRKLSDAVSTTSEATWWVEEEAEGTSDKVVDEPLDVNLDSDSGERSPLQTLHRSASFSSQVKIPTADILPPQDESLLSSPVNTSAAAPILHLVQESNIKMACKEGDESVIVSEKEESTVPVPETVESDGEALPKPISKNQAEDIQAENLTRARRSALNIMLTSQSSETVARQSKLLDKEAAQQVLVQKHFGDKSKASGPSAHRAQSHQRNAAPMSQPENNQSPAPLPLRSDLQHRMDSVLNELLLAPKAKLDLVLKYTNADYYDRFPLAVQLWEQAYKIIVLRESVMKSLWEFEMLASDPRRHFRSLSTNRLREEKERDALFAQLNQASDSCLKVMDELLQSCGDTVYFGNRSYRDKMKKDYTELLYDVEQERLRIIYSGVRPHVAPGLDEEDSEGIRAIREEDERMSSRPSSGRTVISIRVPATTIPSTRAPHRPSNRKDNCSPRVSVTANMSKNNNQDKEENIQSPEIGVEGEKADSTNTRYLLATPRESIYIPVEGLDTNQDVCVTAVEPDKHNARVSRVTVQVQQKRQAEFAALNEKLDDQEKAGMLSSRGECSAQLKNQVVRSAETTFVTCKEAEKSATRSKQLEERASLRELFHQFIMRSKS